MMRSPLESLVVLYFVIIGCKDTNFFTFHFSLFTLFRIFAGKIENAMRKVIGIGETVLDIIFKNDQPIQAVPGGSTFNALISLARSGVPTSFISETGPTASMSIQTQSHHCRWPFSTSKTMLTTFSIKTIPTTGWTLLTRKLILMISCSLVPTMH